MPIFNANPYLQIDTLFAPVSKGLARIDVTGFELSDTLLHLDSIHFGYTVDPYQINRIKGFRAGWVDLQGQQLNIHGIDYEQLATDTVLAIQKIGLERFKLLFFKDKSDPRLNQAYKALPTESIRNIPLPLKLDTLEIGGGMMEVQMQAATGNAPGSLSFDAVQAQLYNITNIPEHLAKNPFLDLQYSDLKIAKLSNFEKFRENQPKNGFFVSMGNLIVPNNRSRDKKNYHAGIVYYEKAYNRDVIHCLVESMLSGLISSFGIGPKNLEQVDKKAAKNRKKGPKVDG